MLGPNCLGVYDAAAALDLGMNEFAPGALGIISQSGNLALELSLLGAQYGIGVSRFASLGNQADIEAAELVEAFAADEHTRVIGVYCEDFRDGRAFARAGEAALRAGKQVDAARRRRQRGGGARRRVAHGCARERLGRGRGCLPRGRDPAGDDAEAAGRLRARRASLPTGRWADGWRSSATGAAPASSPPTSSRRPGSSCRRSRRELARELKAIAPTIVTANPVDLAGAGEQDFWNFERVNTRRARVGRGRCGDLHRVLRRLQPDERDVRGDRDRGRPRDRARRRRERPAAARPGDVLGLGARPRAARGRRARLPGHRGGRRHARAPRRSSRTAAPTACPRVGRAGSRRSPGTATSSRGSSSPTAASPFAAARRATSVDEARAAAAELGYPVALKALGLLHKSDAGGVALGLADDAAVAAAAADMRRAARARSATRSRRWSPTEGGVELIVGCRRDPRFGPLVLVGLGGIYAELLRDVRVALAPGRRRTSSRSCCSPCAARAC